MRELARAGLRNPVTVAVQVRDAVSRAVQVTPSSLRNFYVVVRRHEEKLALLLEFLKVDGRRLRVCVCVLGEWRLSTGIVTDPGSTAPAHHRYNSGTRGRR